MESCGRRSLGWKDWFSKCMRGKTRAFVPHIREAEDMNLTERLTAEYEESAQSKNVKDTTSLKTNPSTDSRAPY